MLKRALDIVFKKKQKAHELKFSKPRPVVDDNKMLPVKFQMNA